LSGNSCTESSIGTTTPEHPRAAYIEGKRGGEFLVHTIAQKMGILAYCARVALAYGPGTKRNDKRVINELIRRGIVEGEVYLKDGGSARRTYGYISDVTYLLFMILFSAPPGTYNVGGNSETTIFSLAQLIAKTCRVPFRLGLENDRESADPSAPEVVGMDLTKTLELGPEPNWVSLEDGLSRTIRWQRQVLYR
jgi:dTDP-glucose 4,6-dehydratase/UDP-glucuronate decarboxylase